MPGTTIHWPQFFSSVRHCFKIYHPVLISMITVSVFWTVLQLPPFTGTYLQLCSFTLPAYRCVSPWKDSQRSSLRTSSWQDDPVTLRSVQACASRVSDGPISSLIFNVSRLRLAHLFLHSPKNMPWQTAERHYHTVSLLWYNGNVGYFRVRLPNKKYLVLVAFYWWCGAACDLLTFNAPGWAR